MSDETLKWTPALEASYKKLKREVGSFPELVYRFAKENGIKVEEAMKLIDERPR